MTGRRCYSFVLRESVLRLFVLRAFVLLVGVLGLFCVVNLVSSPQARAADLGQGPGSLKDGNYVAPAKRNCYARLDWSYSITGDTDVDYGGKVVNVRNDDVSVVGVGFGCTVRERLRLEIAYNYYLERDWIGEPPAPEDPLIWDVNSSVVMANAYYDMGTYRGFKPYIGAGLGVGYHTYGKIDCFPPIPGVCEPGALQDGQRFSFVWALMVGTAYNLTDKLLVDVGYRYINLGQLHSETVDIYGFINPSLKMDDMRAHEIKVGFRYELE